MYPIIIQVFSRSMACGIEFYRRKKIVGLGGSEETQDFTLFLNNLFDALNRRYTSEGITKSSNDFKVLNNNYYFH